MNRFNQALRDLWIQNHCPSLRAVSDRTEGKISHTCVNNAITGAAFPRWGTAVALIEALGGDAPGLRDLWDRENEALLAKRPPRAKYRSASRWNVATVQPGDTLLFTIGRDLEEEELVSFHAELTQEFPTNQIKIVAGVQVAVLTEGEAA